VSGRSGAKSGRWSEPERIPDFLASLPLFKDMSGLEVNAVSAFLEPRRFAAGGIVFREGESGKELFIVRSGRIGSYVKQPDGTRREVYEFAPGILFGEMAIIENEPRSATCYAMEDSELLVLEGLDFYRLVWEHPVIGVKLLSAMARVMTAWLDEASGFLGGIVRWGEAARRRAITDGLSGLFNRRFLEETMGTRFARGAGSSKRCALLMLDIDRFRDINSAFGPAGGDAAIAAVACAFSPLVREGEVCARLAGDEFAVFLPNAGMDRALELAEDMRRAVEGLRMALVDPSSDKPAPAAVTVSIGAAAGPEQASTAAELVEAADKALFKAKEGGRNRVVAARTPAGAQSPEAPTAESSSARS
jgi:diguanylate cyclase (GGDEF)-like protein